MDAWFSFLISWGPIMILDMYASYSIKRLGVFHKFPLRPLFDCVSQTSSILNPFIYAFGDANFKRGLYLCFRRRQGGGQITRVLPATVKESYVEKSNQRQGNHNSERTKIHKEAVQTQSENK